LFVVQQHDSSDKTFPTFDEIAASHFTSKAVGDIRMLSNPSMLFGERAEVHPDNSPAISSFKATFVPGGLIFNIHMHHWSNGLKGWVSFTKQLAENCHAVIHGTEPPSFDAKCLDWSVFNMPPVPEHLQVDAPPRANRHPEHRPSQALLFHLPKSKAVALKKVASPDDGTWISTYDAVCGFMWRTFSRIREPLYQPDPNFKPVWAQGVNMVKRWNTPALPDRLQGNSSFDIISSRQSAVPQLTLDQVTSTLPLSRLAAYSRQMTNIVTPDMVLDTLRRLAPTRNKQDLSVRVDSYPPMTMFITDWREADLCATDFGFGRPSGFRHLMDGVAPGLVIVYPPHNGPTGEDEGMEVYVAFEKELVDQLVHDEDWAKYFEFRGIDVDG
jgi:hypothetical protein